MERGKIIKGSLTTVILQLLKNNGKMYGYEMTKAVREGSQGSMAITEAALYPALHKLEEEGMVVTETAMVDGRLRKYYKLSRQGSKESVSQLQMLEERMAALKKILKYQLKNG